MSRQGSSKLAQRLLGLGVAAAALGAGAAYLPWDMVSRVLASQQEVAPLPPSEVAQPVRVSRIAFNSLAAQDQFTGTVRPRHEADLGFRISGKLLERLASVGDAVRAGQVIARLDPSDAELDLQAAEADLAAARADLARAEGDAARSRKLLAGGTVSQAADDRVASILAEAQGRAGRAQRARELAANRLDYMVLTAPSDGVVTRELAEAGQVVAAGQGVVSLARVDQLDVVFALPEQKRGMLEQAQATARLWEQDAAPYALSLRDVAPDVDPATRTYRVRMAITAPDRHVSLGRTVTITFAAPAAAPVAVLPLAAVLNDGRGPAVWRLTPDQRRVVRVPVVIAALDGEHAAVQGALRAGDLVISLGAHKIDPHRPVRIIETTTAGLGGGH